MKLSCLPVSYFKEIIDGKKTIKEWAEEANEIGFDFIDLSILFLRNKTYESLKTIHNDLDETGIQVAIVNTYPDFTHPVESERKKQMDQFKKDIISASMVGAKTVRITAGQAHPGISRKQGVLWAVENIIEAIKIGRNNGIEIVFENHSKPGVWDYSDFSHPSDIFLEIVNNITEIKKIPLGILFDTANPLVIGEDPLMILEKIIDKVVCIHAADIGNMGQLNPVTIGTGIVPFERIFKLLKKSGFNGLISIEEASGKGREGIEFAEKFVRQKWGEQ